jgi:MinD superfamily P-loop ATPase containing an inserted ferredoxin domain
MKTDIFYFSGTGNSYLLAKMISQGLPESKVFNIAHFTPETPDESDRNCVLAFPTYGFSAPGIVKRFLKKLDCSQYAYFFVVTTKGGSPEFCHKDLSRIVRKKGATINAFFSLQMPNNSYFIHDFNTPEQVAEKIANAKRFVEDSLTLIARRGNYAPERQKMSFGLAIIFRFINVLASLTDYMFFDKAFGVSDDCVSCGICAGVCPSHKIEMTEGKPSWKNGKKCYCCTACINYCPHGAISNKALKPSKTNPTNQYRNSEISVVEMMRNNS